MPEPTPAPPDGWTDRVRSVYDRTARGYDLALSLFPLVGFRPESYRRCAVEALHVRPDDVVLDIGCGTGRNLPLLARALAPGGRLAVLDFRIPRSWPGLVQTAAFRLAAPLGETWEMARRDLRPTLAGHVALNTDRPFFFGGAYVAAGAPRHP